MCGSTRSTTSPSSSSTRRRTTCAAGCCGPKFRVKLRSSPSAMAARHLPLAVCDFAHLARETRVELVPRHHEALMTSFSDGINSIMRLEHEGNAWPFHSHTFRIDRHGQPGWGRCRVVHIDMHTKAPLPRIEM